MSTAKMRIKMGPIEVDYEGTEDFLKQELPSILTAISTLYKDAGPALQAAVSTGSAAAAGGATPPPENVGMSVTTIAAKLGVKSGSDLILAAATRLTRGGLANFPRAKLLEEMKQATGYFNANHTSNLSKNLLSLIKAGKLQETAKEIYALSTAARTELEARLAS